MAAGGYQERIFKSDNDARVAIRRAFRDTNGSLNLSARTLGISLRSLTRYVTKLGLREELRALKKSFRTAARVELPALSSLGASLAGRVPKAAPKL